MKNLRIQFVSDALVQQIIDGRKTASVVTLDEVGLKEDEYNDALVVGRYYDVYDSKLEPRATIRIVAMEICRWDSIPERLWRGETASGAVPPRVSFWKESLRSPSTWRTRLSLPDVRRET